MGVSIVSTASRSDNPPASSTLSHISIVPVPPKNPTIHFLTVAGQLGTPPPTTPQTPTPTSFREQAINAFANLGQCLTLGGATPRDITKINIYVVGLDPSMRGDLIEVITNFFTFEGEQHKPPSCLLGVAALAGKEFLIEVDATAAVTL